MSSGSHFVEKYSRTDFDFTHERETVVLPGVANVFSVHLMSEC